MKPFLFAFLLVAGLSAVSCAASKEERVIEFNDTLVTFLKESQVPFDTYWDVVAPWYAGKKLDIELLHAAQVQIEETHRGIYEQLLAIEVPDDELAQGFHEAVTEYFETDREVIAALGSAVEYISENNPPVGQSDLDHVDSLVDPILDRREAIFERVEAAQQRLAQEYQFALR